MDPASGDIRSRLCRLPRPPRSVYRLLEGDGPDPAVALRDLRSTFYGEDAIPLGHGPWWSHAVGTAEGASLVAETTGQAPPGHAFVAGLLHDIGQLALVSLEPVAFHGVAAAAASGPPFLTRERLACGLDHTEAGELLLREWGFPDPFPAIAREHHRGWYEAGLMGGPLGATVVLADAWSQVLGFGFDFPRDGISHRVETAASGLGLLWRNRLELLEALIPRVTARALAAGIEAAPPLLRGTEPRTALWVSLHGSDTTPLGEILLGWAGYSVVHLPYTENLSARNEDLVLIDSPWAEPSDVGDLLEALVPGSSARVALLADPPSGLPPRRLDPDTGIATVPRLFTAFDLRWLLACPRTWSLPRAR